MAAIVGCGRAKPLHRVFAEAGLSGRAEVALSTQVYQGKTLTSRIKLQAVLATIAKHAFVASPYPIILSLELHLSPAQQARCLAQLVRF